MLCIGESNGKQAVKSNEKYSMRVHMVHGAWKERVISCLCIDGIDEVVSK